MSKIDEKIDAASDSYGNARIKEALRLDRDATVYEKRIQKFDAYDLATAFEQGAKFALSQQWVSVEEELPENDEDEDVLVALENGPMQPFMTVAWYSKADNGERRWYSNDDNLDLDLIRFWMPIPPLHGARKNVAMNTDKPILDACCGGKMFYFDKQDPRVLFQDIREVKTTLCDGRHFEVKPDVVADFTNMPYANDTFSMVVFDPPHLVHSRGKKSKMADMYGCLSEKTQVTGWQQIKYGALYSDWRDLLSKGFAECFRVLRPGGFLIFKWNETDIKVSEILKLTSEKPIFGHISGKRANTHWICFMKGRYHGTEL